MTGKTKIVDPVVWSNDNLGIYLKKSELKQYLTDEFVSALDAWSKTSLYGLANGNVGWANEPSNYIQAIYALEMEKNAMESEEMEQRRREMEKKSKSTSPSTGRRR